VVRLELVPLVPLAAAWSVVLVLVPQAWRVALVPAAWAQVRPRARQGGSAARLVVA
jgi:hypothetical protein